MSKDVLRSARRAAATAGCLTIALLAAPGAAGAVTVNLHVEAGGKALAGGTGQVTRTLSAKTTKSSACHGSGKPVTLNGPTSLGALAAAQNWQRGLAPVGISDEFSFGLFVCSVDGFFGSSDAFWLYKVNHVSPEIGGDAYRNRTGDDVLWFFQNTETGQNTGDELVVEAPARARPGEPVDVAVSAYSFDGKRRPAAGATVAAKRSSSVTTDASGHARVSFGGQGYLWVRAARGFDVPSSLVRVCVRSNVSRCAPSRGQRIYGTELGDRIRGTSGRDVVNGGAGDDVINVRRGRTDRVFCGRGVDLVRASRKDRVADDCEEVRLK